MYCSRQCAAKITNNKHQNYLSQQDRSKQRKKALVEMKGGCCMMCGYNKNYAALCFHHRDPNEKEFRLDARSLSNRNWDAILAEAEKCDLLCHNCHNEHHHPGEDISFFLDVKPFEAPPPKEIKTCQLCPNPTSQHASLCWECHNKNRKKNIDWPPIEWILEELETTSYLALARKLGVSDNGIRKHIQKNKKP